MKKILLKKTNEDFTPMSRNEVKDFFQEKPKKKTNYWKISTIILAVLFVSIVIVSMINSAGQEFTLVTQYGNFTISNQDLANAYKVSPVKDTATICPMNLKVNGKNYCFQFMKVK